MAITDDILSKHVVPMQGRPEHLAAPSRLIIWATLQTDIQGGSNMTGTDYGLFTHKSVPVIFEQPCNSGSVHTCNFTPYRNALTLQVTDKIRSYELNFHPVLRGVTVSCERYTLGFPVCYVSPSDVFAASSGLVHLYRV